MKSAWWILAVVLLITGCETDRVVVVDAPPPAPPPGEISEPAVEVRIRNATSDGLCGACYCRRAIDIARVVYRIPDSFRTVEFGALAPGAQSKYVEVSPAYDITGATAVAGAHVATEILCLLGYNTHGKGK